MKIEEKDLEFYNYCIDVGWTEEEALEKVKDKNIMKELYKNSSTREPREITSSTYKRCQKRLEKKVDEFMRKA
jgi:glutamate dehydrogenase/leucine dehydrogenase